METHHKTDSSRTIKYDHFARFLKSFDNGGQNTTVKIVGASTPAAVLPQGWEWVEISPKQMVNGLFFLENDQMQALVTLPFAIDTDETNGTMKNLLEHWFKARTVVVLLLRLGHYAMGVSRNGGLISSKMGARYVKGKHKKGGQSAMRFTRNRQHWIGEFFDKVATDFDHHVKSKYAEIDHIFLGGDKIVLKQFISESGWNNSLEHKISDVRLNSTHTNMRALKDSVDEVWSATVWQRSK